jgi:hypothetical protein
MFMPKKGQFEGLDGNRQTQKSLKCKWLTGQLGDEERKESEL